MFSSGTDSDLAYQLQHNSENSRIKGTFIFLTCALPRGSLSPRMFCDRMLFSSALNVKTLHTFRTSKLEFMFG